MTKLVLSTGNAISSGPTAIRKHGVSRSNLELLNALHDNFAAAQHDFAPASSSPLPPRTNGNGNGNGIGSGPGSSRASSRSGSRAATPPGPRPPVDAWTERRAGALFIPRLGWPSSAGLREEPSQYEITVKLFLLPGIPLRERERYIREALELVREELRISVIDLLVVSFPGMSFEGSCEWEADKINAQQGNLEDEIATWRVFEDLHRRGLAKRLGVSEFGSDKLGAFIKRATVPPAVDQINLKDCCNVPPPLAELARAHGVELNVHTDCTDILPRGTLRELLGHGPHGAGVLADPENGGEGLKGEITPQWVVRYMAFVRDRGVIENKGYFAGAELCDEQQ